MPRRCIAGAKNSRCADLWRLGYVGDMPHNWASAECILFLRHMLALEDGPALRVLPGIGDFELASAEPYRVDRTPTRFGRLSVSLEPAGDAAGG